MIKILMTACAVLALISGTSDAQTLSGKDSEDIVKVSRNNELKFDRDYKGKTFSDTMTYKRASEAIFGGSWFVSFDVATCSVSNKSVLNEITDWDKGQKVSVTGKLSSTMMGTIHLDECRFASAR